MQIIDIRAWIAAHGANAEKVLAQRPDERLAAAARGIADPRWAPRGLLEAADAIAQRHRPEC